jgi:hypothetical protein
VAPRQAAHKGSDLVLSAHGQDPLDRQFQGDRLGEPF